MPDLLKQLQVLQWGNLKLPCMGAEYGFRHDQAEHKYIYRNGELIESLGRKNPTFRYQIPFREDIVLGPYENLFTKAYKTFLKDCQDEVRKRLVDPVHGTFQAKCVSLRTILDPTKKDGVDVEVEFVKAPFEDELTGATEATVTIQSAEAEARRFDAEVAKIDFPEQEQPDQGLTDPFAAIGGIADQLTAAGNKINATFDDLAYRAQKFENSINKLKEPKLEPARQRARRFQEMVLKLPDHLEVTGNRPVDRYTLRADMDISSIAGLLDNTYDEIITLNGFLVLKPIAKTGTVVRFYRSIGVGESLIRGGAEPLQ